MFFYAVEAARKFKVIAVNCNSVLKSHMTCCFVCVCFCDSFLCSISLLFLSDSLSYVLNSVPIATFSLHRQRATCDSLSQTRERHRYTDHEY